jgi:23S rRNA A1618 N6-methylase RlmF
MKNILVLFIGLTVAASMYTAVSCQTDKPKNLKVLKDSDMTIPEIKEYMRQFTLSLGVECDYCHNEDDYSSDEKDNKNISREMMRIVAVLNDTHFKNAKTEVSCYTCHRGSVEIKSIPPGL